MEPVNQLKLLIKDVLLNERDIYIRAQAENGKWESISMCELRLRGDIDLWLEYIFKWFSMGHVPHKLKEAGDGDA